MKKLLLLYFLLLFNIKAISQTVPITILNGALKACDTNIVTAIFTGIGQHKLTISGELNFGSNTHDSCGKSLIFLPLLYSKLVDDAVCV